MEYTIFFFLVAVVIGIGAIPVYFWNKALNNAGSDVRNQQAQQENEREAAKLAVLQGKVVVDVETTGFSPDRGHKIVSIAAVRLNDDGQFQLFHSLINPQRSIPRDASRVHGIRQADVQNAPVFADIAAKFKEFVGTRTVVAHNATFDLMFIEAELGHPLSNKVIDTLRLARDKMPAAPNHRLATLTSLLGIEHQAHTAQGDAIATAVLYATLATN